MKRNDKYLSIFALAVGAGAVIVRTLIDKVPLSTSSINRFSQIYMSYVGIVSLGVVVFVLLYKLKKSGIENALKILDTMEQEEKCCKGINFLYISLVILLGLGLLFYLNNNKSSTINDAIAIIALTLSVTTDWIVSDFGEGIGKIVAKLIRKRTNH